MDKIKFSVIGFGHIGKRHATILSRMPEAELTAVADVDPISLQKWINPTLHTRQP